MNRVALIVGLLVALGAVTWQFPLFHVVPLTPLQRDAEQQAPFNAAAFAAEFWTGRLPRAFPTAPDAKQVLAALDGNAAHARQQFGRTVGMSRSTFFFLRGEGTVVAVEKSRIGVAFATVAPQPPSGDAAVPDVWLIAGPIFGNAARDATGLLKAEEFPRSQHFNAISAALNALVESRVVPPLRQGAKLGRHIRFVACVEAPGGSVRRPLALTPLDVAFD